MSRSSFSPTLQKLTKSLTSSLSSRRSLPMCKNHLLALVIWLLKSFIICHNFFYEKSITQVWHHILLVLGVKKNEYPKWYSDVIVVVIRQVERSQIEAKTISSFSLISFLPRLITESKMFTKRKYLNKISLIAYRREFNILTNIFTMFMYAPIYSKINFFIAFKAVTLLLCVHDTYK